MNLFRSEEHVKNWPFYDPDSAESIMPLSNWATIFSGPMFRKRLEQDYLSKGNEYASEFLMSFKRMGKAGPFWTPE
jgi:hypothetical protein